MENTSLSTIYFNHFSRKNNNISTPYEEEEDLADLINIKEMKIN